jgi:hypothetical protein
MGAIGYQELIVLALFLGIVILAVLWFASVGRCLHEVSRNLASISASQARQAYALEKIAEKLRT